MTTKNIKNAKSQNWINFEKDRLKMQKFASKKYGTKVFYTEKEKDEIIVFIPEIALSYNKITGRENLLIIFNENESEIEVVFIDTKSLLEPNSLLKVTVEKDDYYESNIAKISEFALFFGVKERKIDLICNKKKCKKLYNIEPFNNPIVKKNIHLLSDLEIKKIVNNIEPVLSKSLTIKKILISVFTILIPLLLINVLGNNIIDKKSRELKEEEVILKDTLISEKRAEKQLKENKYIKQKEYYEALKNKKVLK